MIFWRVLSDIFLGGPGLFRRGMAEMPPLWISASHTLTTS